MLERRGRRWHIDDVDRYDLTYVPSAQSIFDVGVEATVWRIDDKKMNEHADLSAGAKTMSLSRRRLFETTVGLGAAALTMHPRSALAQNAATSSKPAAASPPYRASTEDHPVSIINLDLLEQQAQGKLTEFAYAFVSGGAGDEWTLRENRRAFEDFPIMPRMLSGVDAKSVDLKTRLLDLDLPFPIIVAPMGVHGVVHEQGEVATAAGAGAAGTLYQCSGASNRTMEEIARATSGPKWFQIYFNRDVGVTRSLLQRARQAGFTAIVLTVDATGPGRSERVARIGGRFPDSLTFGNHDPRFGGTGNFYNQKKNVTWDDIAFCRDVSGLPVVVKGILRPDDAVQAVKAGAVAIQVSNHGARQLDGLPASVTALPAIADALGGQTPIIFDSGIRRGVEIFRALALGATAVAIGRPVLYGLGLGGSAGVKSVIDFLGDELKGAMVFAGAKNIGAIDRASVALSRSASASRRG
ncbi:alpha-hydroxy-acid oxidizing protein [Tardiphaga sp.]|uniref:alpha-hydroxy-acid oxidizing protein n=1 Tax=Tardiphaga sp. TaxID=1926292 RepID=UPI00352A394C